ncbi:MAG TPA: hypothetical protein VGM79_26185 [Streptosporangiaceae bacterium]
MIAGAYRDFMTTIAASAASLTGLLFVALSVARRTDPQEGQTVVQQIRAAAALLAFSNALTISLFGLVPGTNTGYPALILGTIGLFFTAAALRSIFASRATLGLRRRQTSLILILLLIFGTEVVSGSTLLASPASTGPVAIISYALVASVLVGIGRAWELVGDRDTGIYASIAVLAQHQHAPGAPHPAEPLTEHDPHYPEEPGGRPG